MSGSDQLVNRVRSYSSGTPGRCLNAVGVHHFAIDEPAHMGGAGEEITPADAFLAGISSCGVLVVEAVAKAEGVTLRRAQVYAEAVRNHSDTSRFTSVHLRFELDGPTPPQAEQLVKAYKGR